MLANDSVTIAVEVPIWLARPEKGRGAFGYRPNRIDDGVAAAPLT